jgi:phytoene dehydrogenase-like protein
MPDYDAIVVGAGHNGLVCAAYLAAGGLRTLLVEARDSVGGCASTVSAIGARVNICNCDHTTFRTTPVSDELRLAEHGLRYLDVEPAQLCVSWTGGPAWAVFHDVERTIDALRLTHPDQVDGYRRYVQAARPVAELVVEAANTPPTRRRLLAGLAERRGRGLATLLRWSRRTVAEVLGEFFTSEALLGPAAASGPAVWGVSPHTPRTGLGALSHAMKHVAQVGRPVGGSGALTDAIRDAFVAAGGTIRCGARVGALTCEGNRIRGVELTDGTLLEAPLVVSSCDPHTTFLSWLTNPPANAGNVVRRWRETPQADGYESKLDAVIDALPRYDAVDASMAERFGFDPLVPTTIVAPSLDDSHRAHLLMAEGRVAERPIFLVNVPSVLDPTMAVADGHVFSLEVLFTPYATPGGWATSTEPERWLEVYASLVQPGFTDHVRRSRVMTPESYESDFSMRHGHATSFAGGPLAAFVGRRPELTRYETPIAGLYLTGAATFPGAGVWGASGRNAALRILR